MRISRIVTAAALAGLLAACASNADPAKGGFISGLSNMASGGYDKRIDERNKALQDQQDINVQQNRSLERATAQSEALSAERNAAEARNRAFQNDLSAMRTRLARADATTAARKRDVADLQRQINALEAKSTMVQQDSVTSDADKQKRLEALRREREALDIEVEMLINR
jgi:septal ring factor EnvC (AmiA/AmiB activator)